MNINTSDIAEAVALEPVHQYWDTIRETSAESPTRSGEPVNRASMVAKNPATPEHSEPEAIETQVPSGGHTSPIQELRRPEVFVVNIPKSLTIRLYTSHFLSTWNSRLFEFAAVLFLAEIFPGTLLPLSVYALVRSSSAILFAQSAGTFIDSCNRLTVVRTSIVGQRAAVIASCGIFWILEQKGDTLRGTAKNGLFAVTVFLSCVEKLCSIINLISVERDWVVVITDGNEDARRVLNAQMRRIDLSCKLLGPLIISLIAIASTLIAIWTTLAMSLVSILVEYVCITMVYKMVPSLHRSTDSRETASLNTGEIRRSGRLHQRSFPAWLRRTSYRIFPIASLPFYFRHPAFLPSFSLSLLYLTVLSVSGQMINYLLLVGYNSLYVGIARTVSSVFELSATWIAPRLMRRIGPIRGGIWSLCWQMTWLAVGLGWFFSNFRGMGTNSVVSATGLVIAVALSRVGLWGFDLCAQNIVQDEVEFDHRGTFSTVEAAFQNLFELLSYVSTIIFSRPDQFQWPAVISVAAVYAAGGFYATFVRRRRRHLFHVPQCIHPKLERETM